MKLYNFKKKIFSKFSSDFHELSLWTATKRLLRFHHISSPLRKRDGPWTRSDKEETRIRLASPHHVPAPSQHSHRTWFPFPSQSPSLADLSHYPGWCKYVISWLLRRKLQRYSGTFLDDQLSSSPISTILFFAAPTPHSYRNSLSSSLSPNPKKTLTDLSTCRPIRPPL